MSDPSSTTLPAELSPMEPPRRWLYLNCAGAILLALVALAASGHQPIGLPGELMLAGAVAARMHRPRISLALAAVGGLWVAAAIQVPTLTSLVPPFIVYSMARWADRPTRRVTLVVMVVAVVVAPISWLRGPFFGVRPVLSVDGVSMLIVCVLAVGSAYAIGRTTRTALLSRAERLLAQQERERHQLVEREQQLRMDTVHERNRIARELHDIIAHSLSVIVVQAEGGKAVAAKDPAMAQQVLTTIADTSRGSLAEMRAMVRLLRGESDEDGEYVPAPGLGDIPELVERTGNATLKVDGDMPVVGDAIGLTAYRVVQESLTNVLKHAGPRAHATVTITYWPGEIHLEVSDDGRGAAATTDGQGNGVRGMRERLELHGGQLLARPQVGGGFLVRARLPYGGAAAPPAQRPPGAGTPGGGGELVEEWPWWPFDEDGRQGIM